MVTSRYGIKGTSERAGYGGPGSSLDGIGFSVRDHGPNLLRLPGERPSCTGTSTPMLDGPCITGPAVPGTLGGVCSGPNITVKFTVIYAGPGQRLAVHATAPMQPQL